MPLRAIAAVITAPNCPNIIPDAANDAPRLIKDACIDRTDAHSQVLVAK